MPRRARCLFYLKTTWRWKEKEGKKRAQSKERDISFRGDDRERRKEGGKEERKRKKSKEGETYLSEEVPQRGG